MMFAMDVSRRRFLKDGRPHFFRIDTAWMALTNLTYDEFAEYAAYRKAQGFNALLIQGTPAYQDMPVHVKYFPFSIREDGSYDLKAWNVEFFNLSVRKMELLRQLDITPFLVPVWGVFLPKSNMEAIYDCTGRQFEDMDDYRNFVDYSIDLYKPFHPVWLIGGDIPLDENNAHNRDYYGYMAAQIRSHCPGDLIGAHLAGGTQIEPYYTDHGYVDFYTYQSGHMYDSVSDLFAPARMGLDARACTPELPVINLEPMYEAHGFGNRFGRFDAFFVRRAFWYSVLSGATAGFAYGAHGIWMFYDGTGFNNERWSKEPMNWRDALRLQGAKDIVYAANLFEQCDMRDFAPAQQLNLTAYDEIRVAATADLSVIAVYMPAANPLYLGIDMQGYDASWYFLGADAKVGIPNFEVTNGSEVATRIRALSARQKFPALVPESLEAAPIVSIVSMTQHNCDALLVLRKI